MATALFIEAVRQTMQALVSESLLADLTNQSWNEVATPPATKPATDEAKLDEAINLSAAEVQPFMGAGSDLEDEDDLSVSYTAQLALHHLMSTWAGRLNVDVSIQSRDSIYREMDMHRKMRVAAARRAQTGSVRTGWKPTDGVNPFECM
jgi:hypothetical protein